MYYKLLSFPVIFTCLFLGYMNPSPGYAFQNKNKTQDRDLYSGSKFSEHVRTTEPRTPEEEKRGFRLPPGFEIELFASEPDIGKPINMDFDARGRLWVTQSFAYPFAAAPGKGKDRITILEDTNNDGRADSFTSFNDTLNIPIGILPVNDGAVGYSIPNVYLFRDTNKDKRADTQQVLLGPFGHRDTHGMVNNLVRGYDGWIHADHGFSNTSRIAGTDGDSVVMQSGNTFRFRPDGSRVEQTTFGRVNPFGLAYDELGYLYSTDCHSSPLYQLIRGGDYPHFGKVETGIGYAPDMKSHGEESTALAGLAYYADTRFPEEYRKNFFVGDVVTCRIHRYSFEFKGSTPVARKEQDFILSADPWFRPVDVKLGPDGALYVADFYNSIIGHYEVPLDHSRRDRTRGRIWRITYRGESDRITDWSSATLEELTQALSHDNLRTRMRVADQVVDRFGNDAVHSVKALLSRHDVNSRKYVLGLWILYRLDSLDEAIIKRAAGHPDPAVRVHAMRILKEKKDKNRRFYELVANALNDDSPHVQRTAVEALSTYPDHKTLEKILALNHKIPAYDSHLSYTVRLHLRNLLSEEKLIRQVVSRKWDERDEAALADAMTGVHSAYAGSFLLDHIQKTNTMAADQLSRMLQHVARFIPETSINKAINLAKQKSADNIDSGFLLFTAVRNGIIQRGTESPDQLVRWGTELTHDLLNNYLPGNGAVKPDNGSEKVSPEEHMQLALELAGDYNIASLEPHIKTVIQQESTGQGVKVAAAKSLLQIDAEKNIELPEKMLKDESKPLDFRKKLMDVLGEFPGSATQAVFKRMKNIPPDLQTAFVMALADSPEGKEIILRKVREGEIFPRTLVESSVEERFLSDISDARMEQYTKLISSLAPVREEKEKLVKERLANFVQSDSSINTGRIIFTRHCSSCHRTGNKGGLIGPQLTGIGNWGGKALAEKILDPNRNISEAFRNYTIKLKNGTMLTGLYRREEGEVIVFADVSGKEFSVPKKEIAGQTPSEYTLMPDYFGKALSQEEFNALLSYLLSLK